MAPDRASPSGAGSNALKWEQDRAHVIFQNRIGLDGRTRVLDFIVRVYNSLGVVPAIATFEVSPQGTLLSEDSRCTLVVLEDSMGGSRGHIIDQVRAPTALRKHFMEPASLLTHDGFVRRYEGLGRVAHLVCFPAPSVLRDRLPGGLSWVASVGLAAYQRRALRRALSSVELAVNSRFTQRELMLWCNEIVPVVLYPPIDASRTSVDRARSQRALQVLLLGRISPQKIDRSLLTAVASADGPYRLELAGQVDDKGFAAELEGLPNVTLRRSVDEGERLSLISRAHVLLHTTRNEHFGLAPVEAAAAGCVPLVHDSGGCRETVPWREQRFRTSSEAVDLLARLNADRSLLDQWSRRSREHVLASYSENTVRMKYSQFISGLIHDAGV